MKKTFLIIIALSVLSTFTSIAAEKVPASTVRNEVNITYGRLSNPRFIMGMTDLFSSIFTLGALTFENIKDAGALSVEYEYAFFDHFAFGGIFSWQQVTADSYLKKEPHQYGEKHQFLSITPSFKFRWFDFENVSMYSRVGVGVSLWFEPTDENAKLIVFPNFECAAVCVDFGSRNIRGLVELGPSSKGLVCAGLSYRF